MKVTAPQLATWIVRDGWRLLRMTPEGHYVYGNPTDEQWEASVTITEAARAKVFAIIDRMPVK
jgi:hypothetical protein